MTQFLYAVRKLLGFSGGTGINLILVWEINIDLISVQDDLDLVRELKLTWYLCEWSKLAWFQCGRLKLSGFQCRARDWLGCCAGGRNWLDFCVRAENNSVLVWESKLTCFLCAGRKWLVFHMGIDWLRFCVGGWKWLGFCVGGRNWLDFRVRAENDSVLVWESRLTLFFCAWSNTAGFLYRGSKLTWFQCRDGNWIDLCVGVQNDLVSVSGSRLTWLLCTGRKWLGFIVGIEIDLFFLCMIKIGLISV